MVFSMRLVVRGKKPATRVAGFALGGEKCTTFNSATFDNRTTRLSGNTSTKTVCSSTVTSVWLECSFWHCLSSLTNLALLSKIIFEFYAYRLFDIKNFSP